MEDQGCTKHSGGFRKPGELMTNDFVTWFGHFMLQAGVWELVVVCGQFCRDPTTLDRVVRMPALPALESSSDGQEGEPDPPFGHIFSGFMIMCMLGPAR